MKTKYPVNHKLFTPRANRLMARATENRQLFQIPPLLKSECQMIVESYYGSKWAMVWALFKETLWLLCWSAWGHLRIRFCDFMGWTKLYDVPATSRMHGYQMRHGRRCSGSPNCNNHRCIEESVPGWYRWITRWEEL